MREFLRHVPDPRADRCRQTCRKQAGTAQRAGTALRFVKAPRRMRRPEVRVRVLSLMQRRDDCDGRILGQECCRLR